MKRTGIFLLLLLMGCAGAAKVRYSQLQFSGQLVANDEATNQADELSALMEQVRGAQFGDAIFKRNTAVYWILPEIDLLELAIAGRAAGFSSDEFLKRQQELDAQHQNHFVFAVDLRMPFNSGWSKERLIEFLETNLIITLENGSKNIFHPEGLLFHVPQSFGSDSPAQEPELEVPIPIRVLFSRNEVLTPDARNIAIKLRLQKPPPFRIGFFDDHFFQGFRWKIVRDHVK